MRDTRYLTGTPARTMMEEAAKVVEVAATIPHGVNFLLADIARAKESDGIDHAAARQFMTLAYAAHLVAEIEPAKAHVAGEIPFLLAHAFNAVAAVEKAAAARP